MFYIKRMKYVLYDIANNNNIYILLKKERN